MVMWLRLAAALLVTLAAIGIYAAMGTGDLMSDRPADDVQIAPARPRELFFLIIFAVVMATALLAAARRVIGRLRRS